MTALLDMTEVCAMVKLDPRTIRRAIAAGGRHKLRATKLRGRWRFDPADVQAWVGSYATGGQR